MEPLVVKHQGSNVNFTGSIVRYIGDTIDEFFYLYCQCSCAIGITVRRSTKIREVKTKRCPRCTFDAPVLFFIKL